MAFEDSIASVTVRHRLARSNKVTTGPVTAVVASIATAKHAFGPRPPWYLVSASGAFARA